LYDELYKAWRKEIEEASLGRLPSDFYSRIGDYLRCIKEENRIPDKKSVRLNLLEHEAQNANRMLEELLRARYKKIIKTITQTQRLPIDLLTIEEAKMGQNFITFSDAYHKFSQDLIQGQTVQAPDETTHKRLVLRFTKSIPAIVGVDMKTYGPFSVEDVASVPIENAKILIKQGLAVLVEVS